MNQAPSQDRAERRARTGATDEEQNLLDSVDNDLEKKLWYSVECRLPKERRESSSSAGPSQESAEGSPSAGPTASQTANPGTPPCECRPGLGIRERC